MPPAAAALIAALALVGAVRIENVPRGASDAPRDVHDGTVVQWEAGGLYYWYGMAYTDCEMNGGRRAWVYAAINWLISTVAPLFAECAGFACAPIMFAGFGEDCGFLPASRGQTVRVWSSRDLVSWDLVGDALDAGAPLLADAILFRPAVVYNRATGKYVLWVNRIPRGRTVWDGYTRGGFVVAEAAAPAGPFALRASQPRMAYGGGGDFALLADGDRAWIAYGSWDHGYRTDGVHALFPPELNAGHRIAVQPLDATFTDVDGTVPPVSATGPDQEAPTLFKHAGYYYLLHGDVCCFCPQGSDAKVRVATDPMGNWTYLTNLNPHSREGRVSAQSNAVFGARLADGSTRLVWTADEWGGARSGRKGADFQFWAPLDFEVRQVALTADPARLEPVPVPLPLRRVGHFELELEPSTCEA